jgi:hypothetical protein
MTARTNVITGLDPVIFLRCAGLGPRMTLLQRASVRSSPARDSAHVTYRTIIAKGYFEMGSGLSRVMM